MDSLVVSTMSLCSKWEGDDDSHVMLDEAISAVPTTADSLSDVVKRTSKSADKLFVSTGLQWRGNEIMMTLRKKCYRGTKGSGEVICGNFRNCVQLSCAKQGAKIFRSGAISAYGFKDLDSFHDYISTALSLLGSSAKVRHDLTSVALAIYDSNLGNKVPLHLRAFAQQCTARAEACDNVEFTPEEFAGIKLKLPHPSEEGKKVSATVRAKGSVKIYMGRPGPDYQQAVDVVAVRLKHILGC